MDFQLVILRGRSASTVLKLGAGVTTAGRHDDCQLRIKSSEVSRKHCQFFEKNGMLLVKDLGSSNGTFLNGKKIEGQRVLEPGDELSVGPVKLRVEVVGKGGTAKPAAPKPGDTAVPAPAVKPGAKSDEFEIDFDGDEPASEEQTVAAKPGARPGAVAGGAAALAAGGAAAAGAATAASAGDDIPLTSEPGMEDDAIADFLLDLKLDDD